MELRPSLTNARDEESGKGIVWCFYNEGGLQMASTGGHLIAPHYTEIVVNPGMILWSIGMIARMAVLNSMIKVQQASILVHLLSYWR